MSLIHISATLQNPLMYPYGKITEVSLIKNTVYEAIVKSASHPNIIENIILPLKVIDAFEFSNTSLEEIKCYIKDLDAKKKTSGNIPSSILKLTIDVCA